MTDYSRDHEWRTLAEHNVQPGDVVECMQPMEYKGQILIIDGRGYAVNRDIDAFTPSADRDFGRKYRVMSRAPQPAPTPDTTNPDRKPWRDMTDAEKVALLLAKHRGEAIDDDAAGHWTRCDQPSWIDWCAYRTCPGPKRKTVTIYVRFDASGSSTSCDFSEMTHTVELETINGQPDCASIRIEALK